MSDDKPVTAAVLAEVETMEPPTRQSPEAVMVIKLAEAVDKGEWRWAESLRRALVDLRKLNVQIRSSTRYIAQRREETEE